MFEGNLLTQWEFYTATDMKKKRCKLVIELDSIWTDQDVNIWTETLKRLTDGRLIS